MEVQLHEFLFLALSGGERSVSVLGRFTTGKKSPVPDGSVVKTVN